MKRDLNLIRKLVLAVEDTPGGWTTKLSAEGYSQSEVGYHAHLVAEAGLANGIDMTTSESGPQGFVKSLTWAGHEFADLVRDDDRWNKAMSTIAYGNQVSFEALKALLVSEARPLVPDALQNTGSKPQEPTVHTPQISSVEEASQQARAKRGPKPDPLTFQRVLQISKSVAPSGNWKAKLGDVCEALEAEGIPHPATWRKRGIKIAGWLDAAILEPQLAIKAIEYRIKMAKR